MSRDRYAESDWTVQHEWAPGRLAQQITSRKRESVSPLIGMENLNTRFHIKEASFRAFPVAWIAPSSPSRHRAERRLPPLTGHHTVQCRELPLSPHTPSFFLLTSLQVTKTRHHGYAAGEWVYIQAICHKQVFCEDRYRGPQSTALAGAVQPGQWPPPLCAGHGASLHRIQGPVRRLEHPHLPVRPRLSSPRPSGATVSMTTRGRGTPHVPIWSGTWPRS